MSILSLACSLASGQPLSKEDYQAGPVAVGRFIRDILPVIGEPKEVSRHDQPQTGGIANVDGRDTVLLPDVYYVYEFDSLTIHTNGHGSIEYFRFRRCDFKTPRGIHVGDSAEAVTLAYGDNTMHESEVAYLQDGVAMGIWFGFSAGRVTSISMGWYTP